MNDNPFAQERYPFGVTFPIPPQQSGSATVQSKEPVRNNLPQDRKITQEPIKPPPLTLPAQG